jgi:hypothetical protein
MAKQREKWTELRPLLRDMWTELRPQLPEIRQIRAGGFDGSQSQAELCRLLARIAIVEMRFRFEDVDDEEAGLPEAPPPKKPARRKRK